MEDIAVGQLQFKDTSFFKKVFAYFFYIFLIQNIL